MASSIVVNFSLVAFLFTAATAYTNHTVGGPSGWSFNATTKTPATNYSDWAATQILNLGDFLIFKVIYNPVHVISGSAVFNTNSNQTVIQTYNITTYQSCSLDDSSDNDTNVFDGGHTDFGAALTIPVPLTIEGPQYYFSDADDGVQCQHGVAFQINVKHGQGLPPSLNQPPPPPYVEPPNPDSLQSPANSPAGVVAEPSKDDNFRTNAKVRGAVCSLLLLLLLL